VVASLTALLAALPGAEIVQIRCGWCGQINNRVALHSECDAWARLYAVRMGRHDVFDSAEKLRPDRIRDISDEPA